MSERKKIKQMQVGDHIALPDGAWHSNPGARELYAEATAHGAKHGSQFQVEDLPSTKERPHQSRLVRIR